MYVYVSMPQLRSPDAHRTSDAVLPPPHLLCPFYKSQQGRAWDGGTHQHQPSLSSQDSGIEFRLLPPGYMNHFCHELVTLAL